MTQTQNETNTTENPRVRPLSYKMGDKLSKELRERLEELRNTNGKNATLNTAALVDLLEAGLARQEEILQMIGSSGVDPVKARAHLVSDRSWFKKTENQLREISWYGKYVLEPLELVEASPLGVAIRGVGTYYAARIAYGAIKGLIFGSPEEAVEAALK